jgi:hypothetical protein
VDDSKSCWTYPNIKTAYNPTKQGIKGLLWKLMGTKLADIASAIFIRQSPDFSGLCRFWELVKILSVGKCSITLYGRIPELSRYIPSPASCRQ